MEPKTTNQLTKWGGLAFSQKSRILRFSFSPSAPRGRTAPGPTRASSFELRASCVDHNTKGSRGTLQYTPEHCLVHGGVPLLWWKSHVSNGGKMYLLRSPAKGSTSKPRCKAPNSPKPPARDLRESCPKPPHGLFG